LTVHRGAIPSADVIEGDEDTSGPETEVVEGQYNGRSGEGLPGAKARGAETRRAVLRAAEEVFANLGYAGARMEDVAERVGIRRASLVYYFRDKQTLYEALLDDLFGGLLGRYEAALNGPGPITDRMLRCIDVWAAHVEAQPSLLRLTLWEIARAQPSQSVPLTSRVQPIVQRLAEAVIQGQRDGVFRSEVDPVGFVMSVAGTTAFLGFRTSLLSPSIAPPLEPGRLAAELRSWVTRVLFAE
jgi:TetR/AcrR family transcriptional regulator